MSAWDFERRLAEFGLLRPYRVCYAGVLLDAGEIVLVPDEQGAGWLHRGGPCAMPPTRGELVAGALAALGGDPGVPLDVTFPGDWRLLGVGGVVVGDGDVAAVADFLLAYMRLRLETSGWDRIEPFARARLALAGDALQAVIHAMFPLE